MAVFDGRALDGANGAVLYLQEKAPKKARLALDSGVVVAKKGSRALVVSILAVGDVGPDWALSESVRVAQEALDQWAVKGVMARTLAAVDEEHILWWERADSKRACRIWTTMRMNLTFEAHGEVRDSHSNLVPPTPEPVLKWHPSFRFFRLGQATTDLVDAFRNYYLALEAVLSTIEPIKLTHDGRPAEREKDWLNRALSKAARFVDFNDYVANGAGRNPVDAIRADIYAGARTQIFHAKTGVAVLLPHDEATRGTLRDTVVRLRRLYLDLAQAVLGFRFLGGGGLAPAGFQAMVSGVPIGQFYVSDEGLSLVEEGRHPTRFAPFVATHAGELDDDYHFAYAGTLFASDWTPSLVRHVGAMMVDGRIAMYEDLEGELDINGLECVECVMVIEAQDPRALGTRYLS